MLDFYRGELSARRLGVLLRNLPNDSALARARRGGRPAWSLTDHLLADLWVVTVRMNARKSLSKDLDHPRRKAMNAWVDNARLAQDREFYMARKAARKRRAT